ncbi:DNA ligase 4; AltName: Full=DNA ligase IV; AltName: Full=Polydeoxyribonucleotide synthase [ATP] 4 [Serendipita indica DSM 11827]|nr:DNA ligase 4; AltName: Full=DNA ligase IV; AltName: Full=Polydeoxyribonucleotide synthase [ATP] 4 [Serendipita indica DSM 11827]
MASQLTTVEPNNDNLEINPGNANEEDFPPEPPNHGVQPSFGVITLLFDVLQAERKQDKRRAILDRWFQLWREKVGPNLYPALRLLLPQKDKERAIYHIKEANIAKALISVLGLEKAPDSVALTQWKRPTGHQKSAAGDFPGLVYEVVAKRSSVTEGTLRIDQLNALLDDLSKRGSKMEHQRRIFQELIQKCTPAEIRWIVRIILKDLSVGVKETTVFSVFHPDATAVFNSTSDLKRVAYQLWDPSQHIDDSDKTVQVFRCFAPMLSKKPPKNLEDAVKRFNGDTFKVEEKLDGERIQLHKRGNQYFYCSRKSKDYTYLYGKSPEEGSLTPFIHEAFHPDVKECILDGEMLVWDPISERYLPFGTLKSHAGDKLIKGDYHPRPCFKVFDLLYLNGRSLTNMALEDRRMNLLNVFSEVEGRLQIMKQYDASTVDGVKSLLRRVMEDRGEGLILKHPRSPYVLNGRVDHWIKIKPEYMDGQGETFDLLVLGGNFGTGKRGGGSLHSFVRFETTVQGPLVMAKCTGLSFADYVIIRAKPWTDWGKNGPPFLQSAPRANTDDKCDLYLKPEDAFVVTVKAAEITGTDQYHMPYTLRFPRAVRIRDEFTAEDAATVSELFEYINSGKKRKQEEQDGGPSKKRNTGKRKIAVVSSAFQASKDSLTTSASDIFAGKTFLVIPAVKATVPYKKADIEQIIRANGGTVRAKRTRRPNEILIYGGSNQPPDVKAIVRDNTQNIVQPQWVLDCAKQKRLLPFKSKYLYHSATEGSDTEDDDDEGVELAIKEEEMSSVGSKENGSGEPTQDMSSTGLGDYESQPNGDWIKVEPVDNMSLGRLPPDSSDEELTDHEELDEGEDGGESWLDLLHPTQAMGESADAMEYDPILTFRHLVFYLDSPSCARKNDMIVNNRKEDAIQARFQEAAGLVTQFGGRISENLNDASITHVVLDSEDTSRRIPLMRRLELPRRRRFVLIDYIHFCAEEHTLANEEDFQP